MKFKSENLNVKNQKQKNWYVAKKKIMLQGVTQVHLQMNAPSQFCY